MFSREDFTRYFAQIEKLERDVGAMMRRLVAELADPEIKEVLSRMIEDEDRHGDRVGELVRLLNAELGPSGPPAAASRLAGKQDRRQGDG
ncbi:MAG: hypothetical protein HY924_07605 [Elusimicrobia bacterium]|nr:hypothetical protein [Elusimicrobiota bacterium]